MPIAASAFVLWTQVDRADVLVADNGGLVGLMTAEGRTLSKPRGSGFVAGIWLENDGAPVSQEVAASRPGFQINGRVMHAELGNWRVVQVSGKTALADMVGCSGADILVSNQIVEEPRPCLVLDVTMLRASGAIALEQTDEGLVLTSSRDLTGLRPWNQVGWREDVQWPRLITAQTTDFAER